MKDFPNKFFLTFVRHRTQDLTKSRITNFQSKITAIHLFTQKIFLIFARKNRMIMKQQNFPIETENFEKLHHNHFLNVDKTTLL